MNWMLLNLMWSSMVSNATILYIHLHIESPSNVFSFSTSAYFMNGNSCLIWQVISFILSPTSLSGPVIDLQKMPILAKKSSFQMNLILILTGMQTSKIVAFEAKKTRTHTLWKADVSKKSHCLVRILVQRHNWARFLRKWASRGHYSQ